MKNTSIWFIVLVFSPELSSLRRLLLTLKREQCIIVDNSPTAVRDALHPLATHHIYVHNRSNVGYAEGMNTGIFIARQNGADWVVLINQDISVSTDDRVKLRKALEKSKPGVLGSNIGEVHSTRWSTVLPGRIEAISYVSGALLCIHADVFDVLGKLPDAYFLYYEDVEYCLRAQKAGFDIKKIDINIHHKDGTSFQGNMRLKEYYLARNHLLFVERNAPWYIKLRELIRLPKTIWEHYSRNEWGALEGVRDYLLRRFGKHPDSG